MKPADNYMMKVLTLFLSVLTTALAFDCKQCMYMLSDNEDVNRILDSTMSGALSDSPISYTADCKDGASSIVSTTCPAKMGCAAMKINALMKAGSTNIGFDMFVRMCGGDVEMGTGCSDMTKFEDEIRESMGASVASLEDMNGAVCVCEEENCNVQQSSELKPDQLIPDQLKPDEPIPDKLKPDQVKPDEPIPNVGDDDISKGTMITPTSAMLMTVLLALSCK